MKRRLISLALAGVMLTGCANSGQLNEDGTRPDPMEGFNRSMFNFNYHYMDPYVVRPIAVVWRDYMPQPARNGLGNFTSNLGEPASMVNNFLQGNIYDGMRHFNRFFLNTLLGMGGFIDVAGMSNDKLKKDYNKEFGQVLGYYDVPYGPYAVLPGYGSATVRDEGGGYVDYVYPVLSWITFWGSVGKWAVEGIETRAQFLDQDQMLANSPDPYVFMREAYFQRHDFLANDGQIEAEKNPNADALKDQLDDID
ncbi:Probable phospholipid-binding lipoprotein mlaA precursor [Pragia fontium]|uniref:Phospholipid-binding lipoprotein MlaA n=1 Tax=Pragia fontium TaxID=82985 RepID=A0ABQ5LF65_9GAMM|nr:phospholipid-binding lipoprotein MlaA [Pragia fontium]AKJ41664.1 ABC transporter permease [Pragia fontium]GKX62251.1 phospholipid-binding lipoprotein MlaA [Pragia fontium]SUB81892.1 Probable phospholipid-binding lipoprotein mlaA precursor [Pragia fontium]